MQNWPKTTLVHGDRARKPWRAIAFALVYPSLLTALYFIVLANERAALQQTAYVAGKLIQFAFPAVWTWSYRRDSFGLPRPRLAGVVQGAAFGAIVGGGMLGAYFAWLEPTGFFAAAVAPVQAKLEGLGLVTPTAFVILGVFYALVHSLLEEYYWRWFVFARLVEAVRLPTAIMISSVGFMAHHVLVLGVYFGWTSLATWLFSAAIAIGGAVWAWLYHRTGSLVGPWLSHLLVDAAIFVIGYDLAFRSGA